MEPHHQAMAWKSRNTAKRSFVWTLKVAGVRDGVGKGPLPVVWAGAFVHVA